MRWRCITKLILHNLTPFLFLSSLNQHFKSWILWLTRCFVFISSCALLLFVCVTLPLCKPQTWWVTIFLTLSHIEFRASPKKCKVLFTFHTNCKKKKKIIKRKNSSFISVLYILICYLFNSNFTRTASFGSLEWLSGCQMSLPVFPQTVITWSGLSTLWNPLHILVSLLNPRELSDSGRVRIGRTDTGLKSKIRLRAGESIR